MKRILFYLMILLSLHNIDCFGQNKKTLITTEMVNKIIICCQNSQTWLIYFDLANDKETYSIASKTKSLLANLNNRKDCAENFINYLYRRGGTENAYSYLKNMGFTKDEIDISNSIYRKYQDVKDGAEIENEKKLILRAQKGEVFDLRNVSIKPEFELANENIVRYINSLIDTKSLLSNDKFYCNYNVYSNPFDDTKYLVLNDTSRYSKLERKIFEELFVNGTSYEPAKIYLKKLDSTEYVVSKFDLKVLCFRRQISYPIDFVVNRDKKTKNITFSDSIEVKRAFKGIINDNPDTIYNNVLYSLRNDLRLQKELKRREKSVSVVIYCTDLQITLNEDDLLSLNVKYDFELKFD